MEDKQLKELLKRIDAKLNPPTGKRILDFIGRYFFTIGFFIMGIIMMFSLLGMYWAINNGVNQITDQSKEFITDIQTKVNKIENLTEEQIDKVFEEQIQNLISGAVNSTKNALYEELDQVKEEIKEELRAALTENLQNINLFDRQN